VSGGQDFLPAFLVGGDSRMSESQWIHKAMVIIAVGVLFVALIMHQLSPDDELYVLVATTALGFLFGKATNGLGKGRKEESSE
jgi:hypothetical protein